MELKLGADFNEIISLYSGSQIVL